MWLLNALLYGVLCLGWGVILYALAVGVRGLFSSHQRNKLIGSELAEFQAWMANYQEWYDANECERNYYCDVFENIVYKWDDETTYNIYEIMEAMQSYIDGVRPMGKMKGGK